MCKVLKVSKSAYYAWFKGKSGIRSNFINLFPAEQDSGQNVLLPKE
jgi:hypothetical protein